MRNRFNKYLRGTSHFAFNTGLCTADDDFTDEERAAFADGGTPLAESAAPVEPTLTAPEPVVAAPAPEPVVAAPAPAEPAPAASSDPAAPAPTAPAAPPQMVPHAALHAERVKSAELSRNFALLQSRVNAMLSARAQPQVEPAPDVATDPAAYLQWLENQVTSLKNERTADVQTRELDTRIEQDEHNFIAYNPDYPAASEHYVQSRGRELLAFHTPQQAQDILRQEVRAIAQQAWTRGVPAAQMIYQLSQARGYVQGQPSVFAPPAAAPAAPAAVVSPAATVAAIKNGQSAAGMTLSGPGGGGAAAATADELLKMDDAEFARYIGIGTKDAERRFVEIAGA